MGVHDFDLARWLMGSEVWRCTRRRLPGLSEELKDVGDIDNAMINLKFVNNALGNIDVSRNAVYGYDIRFRYWLRRRPVNGKLQQTSIGYDSPGSYP
jgi:predicted dehydrogenase